MKNSYVKSNITFYNIRTSAVILLQLRITFKKSNLVTYVYYFLLNIT